MLARLVDRVRAFAGRLFGRRDAPVLASAGQPDATDGTVEPLPDAVRDTFVPRWVAELRTRVFTGLAGVGLMVFGTLTLLVEAGLTAAPDLATSLAVQTVEHPWIGGLMQAVSAIGFPPLSLLVVGGVGALLWLAGFRVESAFSLFAGLSAVLTQAIKAVVARPRPEAGVLRVTGVVPGHSFPSGHTLFYVTFFGFIGYAAYALMRPGRARTALIWSCAALIVLIGPSRIWLGHHWASDVLASYALGLAYLILLVRLYSHVRLQAS